MHIQRHTRECLLLGLASLLLFIPFSGKPFHIDSTVTVYMAKQLLEDPLNPPLGTYGKLLSVWNHTELPEASAFHACPHPPLIAFWTALCIRIVGENERTLNWCFFPFYLGTVLLLYGLCRTLSLKSSFAAALLYAVSPALFVNAQNLMYDVPLGLFCIGTFFFMFRGNTPRYALLAGLCSGCACLTKFTGGTLIIAGILFYLYQRRYKDLLLFLIVSGFLNTVWLIHNLYFFHGWLLTKNGHAAYIIGDLRYRFERMIAYIGGGVVLPVFPLLVWWKSGRLRRSGSVIAVAAAIWSLLLVTVLKYSVTSGLIYWLCASAGGVLILQLLPFLSSAENRPHHIVLGIHALLQMIGGLFLTLYAVRYTLTFLFLFVIILARLMDMHLSEVHRKRFWISAVALSLITAGLLSMGDYTVVDAEKKIAHNLENHYPDTRFLFKGRLGYLYYMHAVGAKSLTPEQATPRPGDLFIQNSFYNDDRDVLTRLSDRITLIDSLTYPLFPLRTIGGRAGFYGNDRLPYAWITSPNRRIFHIYRITR